MNGNHWTNAEINFSKPWQGLFPLYQCTSSTILYHTFLILFIEISLFRFKSSRQEYLDQHDARPTTPILEIRVRFFKKIYDWILKSERIWKWILRFFIKQSNPRSAWSWCVKGTEESTPRVDSLVPLKHILDHWFWSRSPQRNAALETVSLLINSTSWNCSLSATSVLWIYKNMFCLTCAKLRTGLENFESLNDEGNNYPTLIE